MSSSASSPSPVTGDSDAEPGHEGTGSISARLEGATLLVTGPTGFVGKALVAKLLRSVPSVERIYLLVRAEGNAQAADARARSEIRSAPLLDGLRERRNGALSALWREKVRAMHGDLAAPDLGLTDRRRRELVERIDYVVNGAATVKFREQLGRALAVNVDGALRLLELAGAAGAGFLQISTCYVAGRRAGAIPEELLPAPEGTDPAELLDEARRHADDPGPGRGRESSGSGGRGPGLLLAREHGWDDTYTLTKWLAEHALARCRSGVPLTIVRPSIVGATASDPHSGWLERPGTLDPLILEYGRGRLTSLPLRGETVVDLVPVDRVVNGVLAALALSGETGGPDPEMDQPEVYQIATSESNPLRLRELAEAARAHFSARPLRDRNGRPIPVTRLSFRDGPEGASDSPRSRQDALSAARARSGYGTRSGGGSRADPPSHPVARAPRPRAARRRRRLLFDAVAGYARRPTRFSARKIAELLGSVGSAEREVFRCEVGSLRWPTYLETHIASAVEVADRPS